MTTMRTQQFNVEDPVIYLGLQIGSNSGRRGKVVAVQPGFTMVETVDGQWWWLRNEDLEKSQN